MNPQGKEWNLLYLQNTKITLQVMTQYNLYHKFIPMPQAAKAAADKDWKKLETIPAWKLEKSKSKKEVVLEAQRDKKKVHFVALMDICHLQNAELEPQLQKIQKAESCSVVTLRKTTLEPTQFLLKTGS